MSSEGGAVEGSAQADSKPKKTTSMAEIMLGIPGAEAVQDKVLDSVTAGIRNDGATGPADPVQPSRPKGYENYEPLPPGEFQAWLFRQLAETIRKMPNAPLTRVSQEAAEEIAAAIREKTAAMRDKTEGDQH